MKYLLTLIIVALSYNAIAQQSAEQTIAEGNAQYRRKSYDSAMQQYNSSAQSKELSTRAKSYYNLGNAYARKQQWQQAIDAYKKALALQPKDADAKYNLTYAQQKLQQQQQQKQQQQQQQQEKQQQNQQSNQGAQSQQQQPSSMTKEQAEQTLEALRSAEQKLHSSKRTQNKAGRGLKKDW